MNIIGFVAGKLDGGSCYLCGICYSPGRNGLRQLLQLSSLGGGPRGSRIPRRNGIDINTTWTELRCPGFGQQCERRLLGVVERCPGYPHQRRSGDNVDHLS